MKEVSREMVPQDGNGVKAGYNPFRIFGAFALGTAAGSIAASVLSSGSASRRSSIASSVRSTRTKRTCWSTRSGA